MSPWLRRVLVTELASKGITILVGVRPRGVVGQQLKLVTKDGTEQLVEADTIVLAAGTEPNNQLYHDLRGRVERLYVVGDAANPRRIMEAISEGSRIALGL